MKNLYKRPLASFLKIIAAGAVIAAVSTLAGCDNGTTSGGSSGGCKGDGACYYIRASGDYKWCGAESCNVYGTADTGQATISCNCR
jgi:hypothetical protein